MKKEIPRWDVSMFGTFSENIDAVFSLKSVSPELDHGGGCGLCPKSDHKRKRSPQGIRKIEAGKTSIEKLN
jgi:hypothetical protein